MEFPAYFRIEWRLVRGLTRDLLGALRPEELLWAPGPGVGPLWKHFRHVGRVQQNLLQGLDLGVMSFPFPEDGYQGGPSNSELLAYFERLDADLERRISRLDWLKSVA